MNNSQQVIENLNSLMRMDSFENADNPRIAKLTDPEALAAYQKYYDQGCCGFYDKLVEDEEGQLYLIGFNYGH